MVIQSTHALVTAANTCGSFLKTDVPGRSQLMHDLLMTQAPDDLCGNMTTPLSKKHETIEEEQHSNCSPGTN